MFIGREYELSELNKLYNQDKFQFVVIYGRRRVGKTTLINEFCKDKPNIFFVAEEYNDKIALENFSDKILTYFDLKDYMRSFESYEKAFSFLGKQAEKKRLVVVIDEFPYIVSSNKSVPSILQNVIDHKLINTKLFLIICGSSLSFMEKEVLSYKSPLYGRRTAQFKIEPFDYFDSKKFFNNFNAEDKIKAYSILGGIPQYLLKFDDSKSMKENVIENLLNKYSYLYEEPKNLLKQELREPSLYNSIIEAIALGCSKLNEISTKIGESTDKCAKYISTLIELDIVKKELPCSEKNQKRKTIYSLKDNLFKFWYRFVFTNYSLIEQGLVEYVYDNKIEPYFNDYISSVFEEICIQHLKNLNKDMKLPFVFEEIGRWWGNNPLKKREEEIDILAVNKDSAIFGECKWRNEPLNMAVVNSLIEKSSILDYKNKYYALFSKSGFSEDAIRFARESDNLFLFDLSMF